MAEDLVLEKKVADLGSEMPMVEGMETDEELLQARDLMSAFIKAIKAYRFYPLDNPTLKGFREKVLKKFQVFLSRYNSFIIQIGEYDFSFKEKVFYENRDVKSSLAFLFYKDGLRELRFMKGLENWEVDGLMELIKRSDSMNQLEDDLVTLMWERDFVHISYLATDEFLEDNPILIPEDVEQFRRHLVFTPPAHQVEVDPLNGEEEGFDIDKILSTASEEPSSFVANKSVYFLTSNEVEGLRKEVESEIDPTFVFNVTDILFEILALEKELGPYQDAINVLNKILDAYLTLGEFQKACDLLKRVYVILKTYPLTDGQTQMIQNLVIDAGDSHRIERIGRFLEKEEGVRLEDLNAYLVLLQRNAIQPLIKLLGELKNSKMRRVICDALSEIGKNAIELFVPFLDDRRWYLVRNITYVLGRIGKEQCLPYIQKAYNHPEIRVRREAVQAWGLIGGPKAIGSLVKCLQSEDVRIRAMAATNLGKVGKAAGLASLLEIVQSKDFPKKDPTEIRAFFNAIGMAGSNESIPVLQYLLERRSWFGRGKTDEIRGGTANALAMIGTPEARAVLETGKNSKEESIRKACLQAMQGKFS
jgi:tetratricopeptide (TPR) repeat protein